MPTPIATSEDTAAAAHAALAAGEWARARAQFEAVLEHEESPQALEGLGWVGWFQADEALTLDARERAYRAFRAAGEPAAAGRVAAWLSADYEEYRSEDAVARGWRERAHRMLDPLPEGVDHGWLALIDASSAAKDGDHEEAGRLGALGARIGREHAVPDLEAVGLAQQGMALVEQGRVAEGTRRLDEAAAIAAVEQFHLPVSPAWTLCCLVTICDGVGDFPRAAQWSRGMREWSERWGARQTLGLCRTAYGRVLATGGDWSGAEAELLAAVEDLRTSRPGMAGSGLARLAELRMRQGREDEARELLLSAGSHLLAHVGLGQLALDEGDHDAAVHAAERVLRRLGEGAIVDRVPALELLARATAAAGRVTDAQAAAEELDRLSTTLGTPYLLGRAHLVRGEVALAAGDPEQARCCAEDAVDRFDDSSAPYDAARARLVLGRALLAAGHERRGREQARAAAGVFRSLGAPRDVERAAEIEAGTASPTPQLGELTAREVEILRLVAGGLSDAEIAERLVVSPHTVHRHVANVRTKLRLPSRAAAVGYATRAGLL